MVSKFSALCSLYYKEKPDYLEQCFQSLAWQTLQADEIIVVHDGPLTNCLYNVLDKWRSKLPIQEVILPKNVGLGEALNAGLKACNYELVARVDTDDINHKNRFEKQIHYMNANTDISVLSCDINEFDIDPESPCRTRRVPKNNIVSSSLRRNPVNHMAVVFKKSAVMDVGNYKHLHFMEDYYLWIRLQAKGYKIANIDDILVSARIGNGMLERRKGLKYAKSELEIMTSMYKLKLAKTPTTFAYFLTRASLRLLPANILSKLYTLTRKV
ncbi:glycosyltransferase [Vibrio parahaemolyticus]